MQEHIWGLKESRKKNIRHLVRLEVRVFRVQQVTLWSHQHSGSPADTVCAAGLGYKDQAARSFATARCQARGAVLLTRPDVLLLPKCPSFPRQWPLVFLIHGFLSSDSHSAFSYSANIYLVPVVCQTHRKHSGCRREQDKGPDSRASVLASCSSFLPSALLALIVSPSALFSQGLLQDLSDFYRSSPLCHNVCGLLLPAGRTSSSLARPMGL